MKTDSSLSQSTYASDETEEVNVHSDPENDSPILFFDGVCGMCNRFVDFILKHDKQGHILLTPLQGETATARLPESDRENLNSVVLLDEHGETRYSTAVVHVLGHMGGFWKLVSWTLWLIPRPIRNIGYRFIARNRYRMFGKKETCRMPTVEERARFLP